jgi:hypothetical protein
MVPQRTAVVSTLVSVTAMIALASIFDQAPHAQPRGPQVPQALRERVQAEGRVRVIVELETSGPHVPEGVLPDLVSRAGQRQRIACAARPPGCRRRAIACCTLSIQPPWPWT